MKWSRRYLGVSIDTPQCRKAPTSVGTGICANLGSTRRRLPCPGRDVAAPGRGVGIPSSLCPVVFGRRLMDSRRWKIPFTRRRGTRKPLVDAYDGTRDGRPVWKRLGLPSKEVYAGQEMFLFASLLRHRRNLDTSRGGSRTIEPSSSLLPSPVFFLSPMPRR